MEYLLVLPLEGSTILDHDEVIGIEQQVSAALGDIGTVDGHDSESGETNVLILTKRPIEVLDLLRGLHTGGAPRLRAAYRQIDRQDYEVLYPEGSYRFHIA